MFHDGDLNSGISRAITEGKYVACFICQNDNQESRIWEEEWLRQGKAPSSPDDEITQSISDVFSAKAVILRIELGSQEAGFLSAFCPIREAPIFIVIHNGQVLGRIDAGVSKEEFVAKISNALGIEASGSSEAEAADQADIRDAADPSRAETDQDATSGPSLAIANTADPETEASSSSAQQVDESANISNLFPNRAAREEERKAKQEAEAKAQRKAVADRRRREAEEAHAAHRGDKGKGKATDSEAAQKQKARQDWLVQQKQRKDEAKKDRERILAQIEADKQERKARSQRAVVEVGPSSSLSPAADAASRRRTGPGGMANLSIRLFDGTSIKGRFEPSATLATTVRDWIKQQATQAQAGSTGGTAVEGNVPFTFKEIRPPQPSRVIEMSEEYQSLSDMGLVPNATLVLVPVQGYTEAYSGGGGGYVSTALNMAYSVANTATGVFSSALSYVPGFAPAAHADSSLNQQELRQSDSADVSTPGSIKVKTLADQRAEVAKKQDPQTFYNGNSSAFEGRRDDDDEK